MKKNDKYPILSYDAENDTLCLTTYGDSQCYNYSFSTYKTKSKTATLKLTGIEKK